MARKSFNGLLQRIRVLAAVQRGRALTDQELLNLGNETRRREA